MDFVGGDCRQEQTSKMEKKQRAHAVIILHIWSQKIVWRHENQIVIFVFLLCIWLKQMSGDQEKVHFELNWSYSWHFKFDFSLDEDNFNEFDSHGYAIRPLLHKL